MWNDHEWSQRRYDKERARKEWEALGLHVAGFSNERPVFTDESVNWEAVEAAIERKPLPKNEEPVLKPKRKRGRPRKHR
jgi:hypothetical protein